MKKLALISLATLLVALLAGTACASNTGYKLNYELASGLNLVSFPYFYHPDRDWQNDQPITSWTCLDLADNPFDACAVVNIVDLMATGMEGDPIPGGDYEIYTAACAFPVIVDDPASPDYPAPHFRMQPGKAYYVTVAEDCEATVMGAHDDEYNVGGSKAITLQAGNNPISVPYHTQADNSVDLCTHINADNPGGELMSVIEITAAGPNTVPCSFPPASGIPLTAGTGYFMVPVTATAPYDIQWRVH